MLFLNFEFAEETLQTDVWTIGTVTYRLLSHITREFYSIKPIRRNLYGLFSHMKKAYIANRNDVQLFHVQKYNQSTIA